MCVCGTFDFWMGMLVCLFGFPKCGVDEIIWVWSLEVPDMLILGLKFRACEIIQGLILLCPKNWFSNWKNLGRTAYIIRSLYKTWSDLLGSEKIAWHEHPRSQTQKLPDMLPLSPCICHCMRQFFVNRPKLLAATFNLLAEQNLVHLGRSTLFTN